VRVQASEQDVFRYLISDRWGFLTIIPHPCPIPDHHLDTRSDLVTVKMPNDPLPFWKVNVPRAQWPAECPDFLRGISEKDQRIIGTPDEEYALLTWPEVRELVSTAAQPHPWTRKY